MNPRWLLYSAIIALGGVVAGVAGFVIARFALGGLAAPLAAGLVTVIVTDLAAVALCYRQLSGPGPDRTE
jgi:hypothetical protein